MHIGLGLGPDRVEDEDFLRFAGQIGVTHIVGWMPLPAGNGTWELEDLRRLRRRVESFGLKLAALENLPPAHWDRVLLGETGRDAQIENVKTTIRNMGQAGIPCLGYYFSIAGVWGHWRSGAGGGRGGAGVKGFDVDRVPDAPPLVRGQVWGGNRKDIPGAMDPIPPRRSRGDVGAPGLLPGAGGAGRRGGGGAPGGAPG